MKLADIKVGDTVKVRRGYSVRPATVTAITAGRVAVKFEDITPAAALQIPSHKRGPLFGATVPPAQIQEGKP
jgi:hypothetical protein